MEQRQGTIHQHFRVRKRKYGSPSKSPASKASRDSFGEGATDVSPVKKGSLESFVVISKRNDESGAFQLLLSQPARGANAGPISPESCTGVHRPVSRILQDPPGAIEAHRPSSEPTVDHLNDGSTGRGGRPDAGNLTGDRLTDVFREVGDAENYGKSVSPDNYAVYSRRKQKADPGTEVASTPQLTQFTSDFLSNYFSVAPSSDALKYDDTVTSQTLSKKRKDRLNLEDITTQKKPCQYSRLPKASESLRSEEETQLISEQVLETGVNSSAEKSEGHPDTRHFGTGESSEEVFGMGSLIDSQSICASPIEQKVPSEDVTWPEVNGTSSKLVFREIISSEHGQEKRHEDEIVENFSSKINTPILYTKAMDNPNSHEGRRLRTPQTFALRKGQSPLNSNGGLYRSSLFSPGDDFWDEAIEVAGSLLTSKIEVVGSARRRGGLDSHGQVSRSQVNKTGSSGIALSARANTGAKGQLLMVGAKLPALRATNSSSRSSVSGFKDENEEMGAKLSNTSDTVNNLESAVLDVQERVNELKLQTRSSQGLCRAVKDGSGRAGGWLKHLGAKAESPLPVRHFDFSGGQGMHDLEDFPVPYKENKRNSGGVAEVEPKESVSGLNHEHGALSPGTVQAMAMEVLVEHSGVRSDIALGNDSKALKSSGKISQSSKTQEIQGQGNAHLPESSTLSHLGAGATIPTSPSRHVVHRKTSELRGWLPQEVAAVYAKKGLKNLYPWQMECLQIDGVLEGKNLIYSASTSAGKSLVAELLMVKRIIATGRIALFVLPFISICSEKAEHLEAVMEPLGKRVGNYFGSQGSATLPGDVSVAVCTIEKANSLVNKLLEEGRLSDIGMIVIDELHMVGDRERGYLLELLLTKIRFACGEIDNIHDESQEGVPVRSSPFQRICKGDSRTDLQIVGMSATMPNISAVAHWLQASLYVTDFRPVPLEEFIKVGSALYNRNMEIVRNIRKGADCGGKDPDHVIELCHEVVSEGNSVLVFCSSRKACETSALHIAKYLPPFSSTQRGSTNGFSSGAEAVEELRKSSSGLDPVLAVTLPAGVAYHHAGLTMEEREVVEQSFKQGVVRVLTATSTLAAGVNLPARRVIFRQPKVGRDFLDGTRYRQMAGRAGRAGIDSKGESVWTQDPFPPGTCTSQIHLSYLSPVDFNPCWSPNLDPDAEDVQGESTSGETGCKERAKSYFLVLICKPEEVKRMTSVITAGCEPLQSCLTNDKIGMMRALLEVVAGGIVQTPQDVHRYVRCTLFNSTESFNHVVKGVQDALRWLCTKKFVEWNSDTETYSTTPLGRAAFGSSLTPEESLIVFEDLAKAREAFVLASDLHLVYQVTPIYVELEPDWSLFYQKFVELSHLEQAVGNRVGVMEPFLMRMAHGAPVQSGARSRGSGKSPKSRVGLISPYNYGGRQLSMENLLRVCRRFYVALMLSKLVQELPLMEVSDSFKVPRGTVQALQGSAGRFAAMVSGFCQRLGWHDLEGLVSKFQSRVSFGVKAEIVELTEIPFVKGSRARGLYKAGLRTIQAVAEASMPELVKALSDATPWAAQDESRRAVQQRVLRGIARKIKLGAQRIVIDRAEEARIAAFSAVRALGVDAPSLSVPVKMVNPTIVDEEDIFEEPVFEYTHAQPQSVADLVEVNVNLQRPGSSTGVEAQTLLDKGVDPPVAAKVDTDIGREDSLRQDNKENEGKCIKMEDTSVRMKVMLSSVNVEPVIQKFKQAAHINVPERLYGSVGIFKGQSPEKLYCEKQGCHDKVTSGPVDVDKMAGGFDCFYQAWLEVGEFVFDLNYRNCSTDSMVEENEIEGIAVCWEGCPVYYIRLSNLVSSSSEYLGTGGPQENHSSQSEGGFSDKQKTEKEKQTEMYMRRWDKVGSMLRKSSSRKISWNLKDQIRALKNPVASVPTGDVDLLNNAVVFGSTKEDRRYLKMPPIELFEPYLDVRVAAWLLWPDEESSHNLTLEQEVKKRLPGEVAANASRAGRWVNQMGSVSRNGCCRRATQTRALHSVLWKLLVSEGLNQPLSMIEMPLVKVLASMEMSGIGVDMDTCCRTRQLLEERLKELETRAHSLAGISFSLSLPADVANILYKHLKLPVPAGCPIGKHHPSTNKHALELLKEQHPVATVIQEHRKLSKLLHSTLGSIITWAKSPGMSGNSGPVHQIFGRWLHTSTATGRLSMEEPNLQCVENTICLNEVQGAQPLDYGAASSPLEIKARELFVPTQDGWILLSADYSQIEVRLMAHFAEDTAMIDLLSKPSGDLFRMIAAQWTGQEEISVTVKQREQTKRLVYGILYGMGVQTLAEHLDSTVAEASVYLERFKAVFPGITSWLNQALIDCRQRGHVVTLGGRKRFLDKINNGSYSEQARAGRQTANTICQGSAADLIKMAMIKLHSTIYGVDTQSKSDEISTTGGKSSDIRGRCRLLLQIHDELILEVDRSALKEVSEAVRACMEGAAALKVPLRVKIQVGSNWGALKPLEL